MSANSMRIFDTLTGTCSLLISSNVSVFPCQEAIESEINHHGVSIRSCRLYADRHNMHILRLYSFDIQRTLSRII